MQKIIAMVAIAAAAAGAYMKYFVGRLYDAKPLVEVCGEWIASTTTDRERPLLLARAKVVNNGLLPLTVHSESSGVRLLCCPAANWVPELAAVTWEHVASFPILEDHDWLNPGETVHDELLVPLPAGSGALAYLLELRFTSSVRGIARAQREHIVTTARSIVAVDSAAQDKARMEVSG